MRTETTATTTKPRTRKPALRVEQIAAAATDNAAPSHADVAIAIAEERPVSTLDERMALPVTSTDPEVAARIAKERAKLEREEKAAAARRARIEALEQGKPIPPVGGKGLPPVVKMNELGALARQLHRSVDLLKSNEVFALADALGQDVDGRAALVAVARLRDEAMRRWQAQYEQRAAAGAADNDTLHPLGLVIDNEGKVQLVEKPAKK